MFIRHLPSPYSLLLPILVSLLSLLTCVLSLSLVHLSSSVQAYEQRGQVFHASHITQASRTALSAPVPPCPLTDVAAADLIDADTGTDQCTLEADTQTAIASTTKMMTALVALERGDMHQKVTLTRDVMYSFTDRQWLHPGSSAGLQQNDELTLEQLLYGLMLPSGNDAAYAIADAVGRTQTQETVAQDIAHFVTIMNERAGQLGLSQTHFTNPAGYSAPIAQGKNGFDWSKSNAPTASDLVRLAWQAMRDPHFATIVATQDYPLADTMNGPSAALKHHHYQWENNNALLTSYRGTTGIKGGDNAYAGASLAVSATRMQCGIHRLIGVVLLGRGRSDSMTLYQSAAKLLDWGFDRTHHLTHTNSCLPETRVRTSWDIER